MIERDHAPNLGTGLLGANFSRRNRQEATDGRACIGRWIAIDESSYDGDQLHNGDRCMILGSVAIDDIDAAAILDTLRRETGIQKSAPEVKFQKMFPAPPRPARIVGPAVQDGNACARCAVGTRDQSASWAWATASRNTSPVGTRTTSLARGVRPLPPGRQVVHL
ncbi:hypothetical protein MBT84_45695 [Streptomyces sp. MBT84]|uniref:hypothetical protein n=1 Tax=Streptomyces sp. MBT84 TaxID=1488414 RepID=UPI001C6EB65A|nr:hypothetical protein [Streptomyces sp. MBT84]MBW8706949.1 hypothetical protein [Streptomyces sp. MBT84]